MNIFFKHFEEIEDPRIKNMATYPLNEILFLAFICILCGGVDYEDIVLIGNEQFSWFKKYFPYKNGIPSVKTFQRTFSLLDPKHLSQSFESWVKEFMNDLKGVIAIDGKTIRGSKKESSGKGAIHVLSAFAHENGLVIASQKVDSKTNEITAIPELLDMLSLKECIITIDAMGTQREIASKIIEKKADYVLALKGNQGSLYDDVKTYFLDPEYAFQEFESVDSNHGRIEKRKIRVIKNIDYLNEKHKWASLKSIIQIESERTFKKTRIVEQEKRYYISSLNTDPQMILKAIRDHWSIENTLHWSLDVTFKEDDSRVRKDHGPENLSIIRKTCFNLLKLDNTKLSLKKKMTKALINHQYRETLLYH